MTTASPPVARRTLRRSGLDTATTPGKLRLLLVVGVAASLAWGVLATLTAYQHASAAGNVVAVSEPLSLDAEQVYRSLSDADATAATAFLSGGLEPAQARQRYNADISEAAVRIEAASALEGASAARTTLPGHLSRQASAASTATGDNLATLTADLPVYASEVGTAQADNRLGLPLGAAYLREASALLRGEMLPAASAIYADETRLQTAASAQATGLPLLAVTLLAGLGLIFVLFRASRWLTRHTHRVLNAGLLAASVAGVVALAWLAVAFFIGRSDLLHAQQFGSAPALAYARAEVVALQCHTDESLTLIDNSGDDDYQKDYLVQKKLLGPGTGTLTAALTPAAGNQANDWYAAHKQVRDLDNSGQHGKAVTAALSGPSSASFQALSATLSRGIDTSQAVFSSSARSGRDAFTGLAAGMAVASLLMAFGCAWGLSRRLAEYR